VILLNGGCTYFTAMNEVNHYLLYGSGPGVWAVFGALVIGVLGSWLLLVRLSTRLIASERGLVELAGMLLLTALVSFALYFVVAVVASLSHPMEM
jgi:hypothetical protein